VLLVATVATIAVTLAGSGPAASSTLPRARPTRAAYWTVHRGQTYLEIAARTGLTVDELETFNPYTDPNTITPGQRLKLRLHVPPPPPKRKGPRFWTIRSGQSLSSIGATTGHSIVRLQHLNPKLKAAALRPGDRIRLRA
jgi:LysM repeat protein